MWQAEFVVFTMHCLQCENSRVEMQRLRNCNNAKHCIRNTANQVERCRIATYSNESLRFPVLKLRKPEFETDFCPYSNKSSNSHKHMTLIKNVYLASNCNKLWLHPKVNNVLCPPVPITETKDCSKQGIKYKALLIKWDLYFFLRSIKQIMSPSRPLSSSRELRVSSSIIYQEYRRCPLCFYLYSSLAYFPSFPSISIMDEINTFLRHPTRLLLVLVPGKL